MGENSQLRVSDFAPFAYNILQNRPIVPSRYAVLSRAHFNPAVFRFFRCTWGMHFARNCRAAHFSETTFPLRPTVPPRFDIHSESYRERQCNDIAARGKSQSALSEKSEKRISTVSDGYSSWMHLECYVHSALRETACMRSGRCECAAHRPRCIADPPDACMHPRCVTLVFYRVKHRGGCVGRFTRAGWFRGETTRKDRERDGSGIQDIQAE